MGVILKKNDDVLNQKLDAEEREILDSFERDEWISVKNAEKEKAFAHAAAANYFKNAKGAIATS